MRELHGQFIVEAPMPTVKSLDDEGDIIIEGYAADWEKDRQNERFLRTAFDEAVKKAADGAIPLLLEHSNNHPLGVVEELRPDNVGLWARARITAKAVSEAWDGAKGKIEMIRRGVMKGLSVRGHSWGKMTSDGPVIGHIDLAEISVTPVPVQPGALFAVVQKSLPAEGMTTADGVEEWAVGSTENFTGLTGEYSEEEVRRTIDAYFKKRIKETKDRLKTISATLDRYYGKS
jgi:HK97 family phage prohead protease